LRQTGFAVTSIEHANPADGGTVAEGDEDRDSALGKPPVARPLGLEPGGHPLGPLVYRVRSHRSSVVRVKALMVLAGCMALLAMALLLKPDPSGVGTHTRMGWPPCTMLTITGYPCPTCGMTTAFAYAVRGQWLAAFHAQPAGFLLAMGTMIVAVFSFGAVISGRAWAINWYRISPGRTVVAVVAVVLLSWAYKIVAGLMSGTLPYGR
jgi:hypothetical protein